MQNTHLCCLDGSTKSAAYFPLLFDGGLVETMIGALCVVFTQTLSYSWKTWHQRFAAGKCFLCSNSVAFSSADWTCRVGSHGRCCHCIVGARSRPLSGHERNGQGKTGPGLAIAASAIAFHPDDCTEHRLWFLAGGRSKKNLNIIRLMDRL